MIKVQSERASGHTVTWSHEAVSWVPPQRFVSLFYCPFTSLSSALHLSPRLCVRRAAFLPHSRGCGEDLVRAKASFTPRGGGLGHLRKSVMGPPPALTSTSSAINNRFRSWNIPFLLLLFCAVPSVRLSNAQVIMSVAQVGSPEGAPADRHVYFSPATRQPQSRVHLTSHQTASHVYISPATRQPQSRVHLTSHQTAAVTCTSHQPPDSQSRVHLTSHQTASHVYISPATRQPVTCTSHQPPDSHSHVYISPATRQPQSRVHLTSHQTASHVYISPATRQPVTCTSHQPPDSHSHVYISPATRQPQSRVHLTSHQTASHVYISPATRQPVTCTSHQPPDSHSHVYFSPATRQPQTLQGPCKNAVSDSISMKPTPLNTMPVAWCTMSASEWQTPASVLAYHSLS